MLICAQIATFELYRIERGILDTIMRLHTRSFCARYLTDINALLSMRILYNC